MTDRERAAWAELAMHLRTRAGGFGAIARQESESATRVEERYPEEARIRRESAEHHDARATVAAEMAVIAKQKAEGSDV
jgi:hypothetical protein